MRLLVLGGTRFVGRAVIHEALTRGWDVTAVHRGLSGAPPAGSTSLLADRTAPEELARVLGKDTWDLAVDTWDGAPRVATEAAQVLRGRVQRYGYVSSMSVYAWGSHVDESSPLVAGDALADDGDYPALKRGAELGVLAAHPDAVLARAVLILGPYEDIGRLPWWLQRISRAAAWSLPDARPARCSTSMSAISPAGCCPGSHRNWPARSTSPAARATPPPSSCCRPACERPVPTRSWVGQREEPAGARRRAVHAGPVLGA